MPKNPKPKNKVHHNSPALFRAALRFPSAADHKYSRGHAIIVGGGKASTGAARLAAYAALRAGAGLATVLCDKESLPIYAASMMAVMTHEISGVSALTKFLQMPHRNSVLIGPGAGISKHTRAMVLAILKSGLPTVLDADALTVFEKDPETLFAAIHNAKAPVVMTPHEGEFARIFRGKEFAKNIDKTLRAKQASQISGAVVVLKGYETVIATPAGEVVLNTNATPPLATAGSGDVLAGIITGLLATEMSGFLSACAGVWMHGEAGKVCGAGLIAEDLLFALPDVIKQLQHIKKYPTKT